MTTYIREDVDKLHRLRTIASVWAAVLLIVMLACLWRVDAVCKMQADTLDQVMELRQEVDELGASDCVVGVNKTSAACLTSDDFELVCRVVAAEARGEGYEGQLAVAQVIRDRARLWGMTPAEAVTAPGQFAAPYQGEIGPDVQAAVNDCLVLGESAFDQTVTHFAEVGITPYWAEGKEIVGVIGSHRFYK